VRTVIEVNHPAGPKRITLRASPDWDRVHPPVGHRDHVHVFELDVPEGDIVELKPVLDGNRFAHGLNYSTSAGEPVLIEPHFESARGALGPSWELSDPSLGKVLARVWLPPSYVERTAQRYPVIYALDGQNVFGDGEGSWHLDRTIEAMHDLRTIVEPIIVAIHTDEDRLARLSPVPDPEHGGGNGPALRDLIANQLVPRVERELRAAPARESRIVMGSSMGGLFAFWSAWTRHDLFGKAACLSPSFWWAGRAMVRVAQQPSCPYPRPWLYFDSGAANSPLERDVSLRDGWADTSALRDVLVGHSYESGKDLYVLAFPGATHDEASWAARLAIPLQLLLPRND
jgi:enterochelin esterase-like enzyme